MCADNHMLMDDRYPADLRRDPREEFCAYALEDWIEAARRAGVPYVSAEKVAVFEKMDLQYHEYSGPHQKRLDNAFEKVASARRPQTMMRWDCCASGWIKASLSAGGNGGNDEQRQALPVDSRLLEVLEIHPRMLVPVWQRPWIKDLIRHEKKWPVEYRAFISEGRLTAISSYYIQRPLQQDDEALQGVAQATRKLVTAIEGPLEWPPDIAETMTARLMVSSMSGTPTNGPTTNGIHGTVDFVVTEHGVLMLEGGPPWWAGAHPCCFATKQQQPAGVRLSPEGPTLPLPE